MAKRNQHVLVGRNKPGRQQNMTVTAETDPYIKLVKTNPGATWLMQITESSISFSDSAQQITNGPQVSGRAPFRTDRIPHSAAFSGTLTIPENCIVHALGLYVSDTLSGSTGGTTANKIYLKNVGITASADSSQHDIADRDYWYGHTARSGYGRDQAFGNMYPLSESGNSAVYFPLNQDTDYGTKFSASAYADTEAYEAETGWQIGVNLGRKVYHTGFTGSNQVAIYFELTSAGNPNVAAITNPTGSITYALYYSQFGAPTSG
jgi:hypothetical protein